MNVCVTGAEGHQLALHVVSHLRPALVVAEALRQLEAPERTDADPVTWWMLLRAAVTARDARALKESFARVPRARAYLVAGAIAEVFHQGELWDDERSELEATLKASGDPAVRELVARELGDGEP